MIFEKFPQIIFATSKVSDGNMSLLKENPTEALGNRKKFFKKIGIDLNSIVELKQVHGNKIIKVTRKTSGEKLPEADGLLTNKAGIYLLIKAADCQQIAFYDRKNQAIALIHAGWRGLEKRHYQKKLAKNWANFSSQNHKTFLSSLAPQLALAVTA